MSRLTGRSIPVIAISTIAAHGQVTVWDLQTDWSDATNPNGVWSYNEGTNALPHLSWWQRNLGGWTNAQPGWARSEDSNNRLPFWFQSTGSEDFVHDWQARDVVVHTTDDANGVGNGPANLTWTSPMSGIVDISGGVWMGRDIGRAIAWTLYKNDTPLTSGAISSSDPYSRTNPFTYALGSGGAGPITGLAVVPGDVIKLELVRTGPYGDFAGVNLSLTSSRIRIFSPELPGTNFTFSYQTVSNQSYTIQSNSDLGTTNWMFYTNFIGNGLLFYAHVPVSTDSPQRFFRVRAP
jgi:hypothetical protein